MYSIHMGVPEMETLWNDLRNKVRQGVATKKRDQDVQAARQSNEAAFK